jgi:putative transposase
LGRRHHARSELIIALKFRTASKDRFPFLSPEIRPQVQGYLASLVRDLDSRFVVVGGIADHVHILFELPKGRAAVECVEVIKRESSKWIKTLGDTYRQFYWQRGYGQFSVGPLDRDVVENYVRNQEEHHRKETFQDEFRKFLTRYSIAYDERYVWD